MYRIAGVSAVSFLTICSDQTLSNRVFDDAVMYRDRQPSLRGAGGEGAGLVQRLQPPVPVIGSA